MKRRKLNIMVLALCGLLQSQMIWGASINYNLRMKVDNLYFAPKETDGTELRPILYEGSIYLPVRALGEAIGAQVEIVDELLVINYHGEKSIEDGQVPYVKSNKDIKVEVKEQANLEVDGKPLQCRVLTYNGRSYLPVRVLAEQLGIPISYNKALDTVLIGESSIVASDYEVKAYEITDEEIQKKIAGLRKKFPHHKYWNTVGLEMMENTSDFVTDTPCDHGREGQWQIAGMSPMSETCNGYSGVTGAGIQCYGFATKLQDEIFGIDAPVFRHKSYEEAKVGDHVRVPGHSMVIIEKAKDYIVVVEANAGKPCRIVWDRKLYKQSLKEAEYISRY